jgi:tetratricopeptide (TPR) repeat protein
MSRAWAFRLVTAIALPLALLGALEGALRLIGAGHSGAFTVPCMSRGRPAFCDNYRFTEPFFPRGAARAPPPLAIPAEKAPGTYRIFVLGESAALGDPEPAYGFSRYLEVLLRGRFPSVQFEVINAATTAINSHLLLPIARDLARRQPDLFVLYIGNNEVVGPFGMAAAPSLVRARIALSRTRLGQVLGRALERGPAREWRGMEMFLDHRISADSPRLERVYENFARNLRDIVAVARGAGARVVVSTVATNLRDSAPFASQHRAGLSAADLASFEMHYRAGNCDELRAAMAIDDRYADLHFRLARCVPASEARAHFIGARDLDALRFRADSRINRIIKETPGVELVDAEAALADVPDLFWEHVHFTPRGNELLARTLLPAIERGLPGPPAPFSDDCDRRLALTRWDLRRMARDMFRRIESAPFTNQLDHAERLAAMRRAGDLPIDPPAVTDARYRQAIALAPDDPLLRIGHAAFLAPLDPAAAIAELRPAIEALPTHPGARELLAGSLGKLGRHDEAVTEALMLLEQRPDYPPAYVDLGYLLAEKGDFDQSVAAYRRAAELAPSLAPGVLEEIGRIRAFQQSRDAGASQMTPKGQ